MSMPKPAEAKKSNRELFFKSQREIEAQLAQIALEAADVATISIPDISLPHKETAFDLSIIHESMDKSLVSAAFTYHRGIDSLTLPLVRLKMTHEENGENYATREQLYPDE